MKVLRFIFGVLLFGALIVVVQFVDSPLGTPAAKYKRLPDASLQQIADADLAAGRSSSALLLLDYAIENDSGQKQKAVDARQRIFAQLASQNTPTSRLKATGWAAALGGNSFENLAGTTVADGALYGDIAELARQGGLEGNHDGFISALDGVAGMAGVFPPAEGAITLTKAARVAGAINDPLIVQLTPMLNNMQSDPRSGIAVEKFREISCRCSNWPGTAAPGASLRRSCTRPTAPTS